MTNPNNGMFTCSLGDDRITSYEDTCSFTCNTGYELTGSDTRTCQSDGSWSGTDDICRRGMLHCYYTYVYKLNVHIINVLFTYVHLSITPPQCCSLIFLWPLGVTISITTHNLLIVVGFGRCTGPQLLGIILRNLKCYDQRGS